MTLSQSRLMELHGTAASISSDNGAEFTAGTVVRWLRDHDIGLAFIAPCRPWQNGYV